MRTNSPIDDAITEDIIEEPKKKRRKRSDWEKLAKSKAYPNVDAWIEAQIVRNQHFLPGGDDISSLSGEDLLVHVKAADMTIKVLREFQGKILAETVKR